VLIFLGAISLLGTPLPACHQAGAQARSDAGATGGSAAQNGDGAAPDVPVDSRAGDSSGSGGTATGGGGGGGNEHGTGGGGAAGGDASDAGTSAGGAAGANVGDAGTIDLAPADGGTDRGGAGGHAGADGAAGAGGAVADGGAPDVMFPCGPCPLHWVCGGSADAGYIDILLTPEEDGCYLSGLPGHELLAADGTITENGVAVATAKKFGPQVGLYYPDGSQWLYCGGNLPCNP